MNTETHDRTRYEHEVVELIQQVFDMLIPTPSLQYIFVVGFPGTTFPEWLGSKPEATMSRLQHMHLNECISCLELSPVGQMPQLKVLQIKGADAIETIGIGLLGKGVGSPAVFFPELIMLRIIGIGMCKLEHWSLDTGNPCDNIESNSQQLSLIPTLSVCCFLTAQS